jgi:anti-sigma regulatory factor (Ser/Thr protein kinase)
MPPARRRKAYRLLVIGQAPDLQSAAAAAIRGLVCTVDQADSVGAGLERLCETAYDVVVAELDDTEALKSLRAARPASRLVLIADRSTPEAVIEAMRQDAYCYFSRPFDMDLAAGIIRQALEALGFEDDIELLSALPEYLMLRLRCALDTADRLVQFCREIPVDLPEEEKLSVADAFREMLLNAIEHGGKLNPKDWVKVARVRTERTLVYYIQDPGEGFQRNALAHAASAQGDPTAHVEVRIDQGMRPGGFGILITSKLVDEVIYNEQGNEVILIKYLD